MRPPRRSVAQRALCPEPAGSHRRRRREPHAAHRLPCPAREPRGACANGGPRPGHQPGGGRRPRRRGQEPDCPRQNLSALQLPRPPPPRGLLDLRQLRLFQMRLSPLAPGLVNTSVTRRRGRRLLQCLEITRLEPYFGCESTLRASTREKSKQQDPQHGLAYCPPRTAAHAAAVSGGGLVALVGATGARTVLAGCLGPALPA